MSYTPQVTQARKKLLDSVFDDEGTFVRLRLGQFPGREPVDELRHALEVLAQHFQDSDTLPREIIAACAAMIHFGVECNANADASTKVEVAQAVRDLSQWAFNVLTGWP